MIDLAVLINDKAVLADQLELLVLFSGRSHLSRHELSSLASDHWGADSVQISFALEEIRQRRAILGHKYPIDVKSSFLARESRSDVYECLLGLTRSNFFDAQQLGLAEPDTKLLETIVEQCVSRFFGPGTSVTNFGYPSGVGRPPEFPQAISWLAEQMQLSLGTAYRQPRRKDGGVDVVVWRSFPDRKAGIPVMLVQVTLQQDFVSKARDIDRRIWSGWLAMDTDPLVALAIPGTVSGTEAWNEVSRNCLLLDRLRLTDLADSVPLDNTYSALTNSIRALLGDFD